MLVGPTPRVRPTGPSVRRGGCEARRGRRARRGWPAFVLIAATATLGACRSHPRETPPMSPEIGAGPAPSVRAQLAPGRGGRSRLLASSTIPAEVVPLTLQQTLSTVGGGTTVFNRALSLPSPPGSTATPTQAVEFYIDPCNGAASTTQFYALAQMSSLPGGAQTVVPASISAGWVAARGRRPLIVSNQVRAVASGSRIAVITSALLPNMNVPADQRWIYVMVCPEGPVPYKAYVAIRNPQTGDFTDPPYEIDSGRVLMYNEGTGEVDSNELQAVVPTTRPVLPPNPTLDQVRDLALFNAQAWLDSAPAFLPASVSP